MSIDDFVKTLSVDDMKVLSWLGEEIKKRKTFELVEDESEDYMTPREMIAYAEKCIGLDETMTRSYGGDTAFGESLK